MYSGMYNMECEFYKLFSVDEGFRNSIYKLKFNIFAA